ncbi:MULTISPECIES: CBS domain-containing protein [unclassified Methanoculleus]|uniref:CBS domain-containing protein n=1 Tax=unclassified Methanoculleus TaxID=2619537 RepID=UPI0025D371B6|nr:MULTISPECIES: CBS domain-containing protein [unclassified Methanoculleus]MCK9318196.1 CBS domain-containing protein [Methanoculleus sp.]MDD2254591.1 CBS domain-containing protein [Methanoculleus sp.]MDD2786841.1 CBS domain-containing protein [Methanoculleus sp.]MDD3216285.1 CBS domain-containing protein [Methanoculleus sp.]MDD4314804.1 CBS domain-containing protein [Methanoculleus sp.]
MGIVKCCREQVVAVSPDTPAVEVARIMGERNVGSVVIVTGDNRPAGILTDRDLAIRVMAQEKNPGEVRAGDIVTRDVVTFHDNMGIYEAIQKMTAEGIRRMPITDDAGKLIGIVTMDDIVRMLGEEMASIAKNIEKQSPPMQKESPPMPM